LCGRFPAPQGYPGFEHLQVAASHDLTVQTGLPQAPDHVNAETRGLSGKKFCDVGEEHSGIVDDDNRVHND
jgi:hypothetical protein